MTFHNKNVLIACSDKKDRLQFFNYFDELDAEKIFTASDIKQMRELLAQTDDPFNVVAFEISSKWVQNIEQIKEIVETYSNVIPIALVSTKMKLTPSQRAEIEKYVDGLFFSPISQPELLAKGAAQEVKQENLSKHSEKIDELENYLSLYFQMSSLPKALIDTKKHEFIEMNDAFIQEFDVKKNQLKGQYWHKVCRLKNPGDLLKLQAKLNESGHYSQNAVFKLEDKEVPLRIEFYTANFDSKSYYLAEFHNQTEKLFHTKFLRFLNLIAGIDFSPHSNLSDVKKMIKTIGVEFCFVVKSKGRGGKQEIVWDCSLNNYAEYYIASSHEFIHRKSKSQGAMFLPSDANKAIPADEFLNFYRVSSLMTFDCSVNKEDEDYLIVGGLSHIKRWDSFKLLFAQLANQFKKSQAFQALQKSHESESRYDVLTELLNRRYIIKTIETAIEQNIKLKTTMALLFIDLDRFKIINDSLGHDVGDDVLVNVAKILQTNVGHYGVAARYAGDEFLVFLYKDIDKDKVAEVANNILIDAANPIKISNGSEITLTLSIGGSYFPEHGSTVSKLIKNADVALYNAKLNGKNRYVLFDDSLDGDHAKQSEEMVRNLQAAIDQDQIDVYYQPKIDANSEDIIGFEALVRWEHPELGLISPGLFIPLAEQSELIFPIGLLVIEKACKCLKKWQERYKLPLSMSINLSPIQLNDKNLTDKISHVIESIGIHPSHIDFEITESEKFKSVKDALLTFKKIVSLGCTLSIDDFGTGHSTLDYLRKIPAKTLKIDQVFVKNIGLSPDDEAILDATIDMAKRVGHHIVAEGVETEEQRIYLTNKGCDYFQGYLFSRPLPVKEIERILHQREEILEK
ncbi:MAG: bifunctional diguanylate cyclase/phosphodiesterase [Xanthomonadales bacterium]|nr:bifunctional diguanylate cyclase/phosphodiesterase [Xanthomonadales bacterium]